MLSWQSSTTHVKYRRVFWLNQKRLRTFRCEWMKKHDEMASVFDQNLAWIENAPRRIFRFFFVWETTQEIFFRSVLSIRCTNSETWPLQPSLPPKSQKWIPGSARKKQWIENSILIFNDFGVLTVWAQFASKMCIFSQTLPFWGKNKQMS